MKRRSWKVWLAGIALAQLLFIGVDVALWPMPSEAERAATRLHEGMAREQVLEVVSEDHPGHGRPCGEQWHFDDESILFVYYDGVSDNRVIVIHVATPHPVPPLTRLRRTLARAFPFLKE
jgi:hypothetical protein